MDEGDALPAGTDDGYRQPQPLSDAACASSKPAWTCWEGRIDQLGTKDARSRPWYPSRGGVLASSALSFKNLAEPLLKRNVSIVRRFRSCMCSGKCWGGRRLAHVGARKRVRGETKGAGPEALAPDDPPSTNVDQSTHRLGHQPSSSKESIQPITQPPQRPSISNSQSIKRHGDRPGQGRGEPERADPRAPRQGRAHAGGRVVWRPGHPRCVRVHRPGTSQPPLS